jgi:hypothetical protein
MGCTIHIGREFLSVPREIRKKLRSLLEQICDALQALGSGSALIRSIHESTLAITVGAWRFRYEFEPRRNRLTVIQATQAG